MRDSDSDLLPNQLIWAVQALACNAEEQLSLFPDFVVKADELATDFSDGLLLVRNSEMSASKLSVLRAIDTKLGRISADGAEFSESVWTDQGLRESEHWSEVRALAKEVLREFDLPLGPPPQAPNQRGVTYVPDV